MRRLLMSCLCLGLLVLAVRAGDDKKEEKKPGEVFKGIMEEGVKKFRAAKEDSEKQKILKSLAGELVTFAEKNAKAPEAVQALMTIVAGMPLTDDSKDGPKAKAMALLKKDHMSSPAIARMIPQLGMANGMGIVGFLKEYLAQSKEKAARLGAVKALLGACENTMTGSEDQKVVEAARKEMAEARKLLETEFKGQVKDLFIGAKMPELTSKDLNDKDVKLSDLKGKVVVVDIWATWCGPCVAMIPHSRELVKRMKDKPFALVSISFDEKKETVTGFLEKNEMPWTHWFNGRDGMIGKELEIQFFPTIYVVDAKGVIRYKNVREKQLDKAVDSLIKEMDDDKKAKTE